MNRIEREIKNAAEILDVLERCKTIRLGLLNQGRPYVVPVSFGLDIVENKPVLYFHGAGAGLKSDCMEQSSQVCIEADIFYKIEPTKIGITTRYESLIGFGTVNKTEGKEKIHGLRKIVEHYGYDNYPIDRCKGLDLATVYKIELSELTGKRNLPGSD